jgi:beta-lactamase regulating signal transducer with metallopeptidase domain
MNLLAPLAQGGFLTRVALGTLLQATAVILVAALLSATLLRRRAAARYSLWLVALVWVILSPTVVVVAGRVSVPVPLRVVTLFDTQERALSSDEPARDQGQGAILPGPTWERNELPVQVRVGGPGPANVAAHPQGQGVHVAASVLVLWAIGLLIGLGRIGWGWRKLAALTRKARPLDSARYGATLAAVRDALGVDSLPPVLASDDVKGPVALGLFRPRVLLPEGLAEVITRRELRDILVHECAHALRHDPWVGLAQRLIGSLYWPYPPVHYLNCQLSRAREEVCDNHVLRCDDACGYARALLNVMLRCRPFPGPRPGLGLIGTPWTLTDRVAGLLDPARVPSTQATGRAKAALATTLVATGLTAASVQFAPAQRAEGPDRPPPQAVLAGSKRLEGEVWRLEGIVIDEQGRPVAGALVRPPASADPTGVQGGTTAPDGRFVLAFSGRHRNVYGLVAESGGGALVGLARDGAGQRTRKRLRIVVKPTRPLTVRVKDAKGAPVAGADVEAVEFGYQTRGRTGPDGTATLPVATDALIRWVVAQKAGAGLDYIATDPLATPDEPRPLPREVVLTLDGAVPLRIKAVDPEGRPAPGVRISPVVLQRPARGGPIETGFAASSWVTTDENGVAVFDRFHKEIGGCAFWVRSEEYLCAREPTSARDGPTELTAQLVRPARLSGKVTLPDGRPARDVIVRVEASLPLPYGLDWLARTADDGTYSLNVLPERAYIMAVEDESWVAPSRSNVVVREGRPVDGLDFALVLGTLVHGRVTQGGDGKPSVGTGVALTEEGPLLPKEFRTGLRSARLTRSTVTDGEGRYRIRAVPGRYTLKAGTASPSVTVEIKDEPEVLRDLTRKTPAGARRVDVRVVERTGAVERPVPWARVTLFFAPGGHLSAETTDNEGRVGLRVFNGTETFLYARDDSGALCGVAQVPEAAAEVTLVMARAAEIRGQLVDTDGKPQARRQVGIQMEFVQLSDGSRRLATPPRYREFIRTDEQGRFAFRGVPAESRGEVFASHERDGRATRAQTVVLFQVDEPEPVEISGLVVPPP